MSQKNILTYLLIAFLTILPLLLLTTELKAGVNEATLRLGVVLNKGDDIFYNWVVIQENDYYIKNKVAFGYEAQFSYYKTQVDEGSSILESSRYPINTFFNLKYKILSIKKTAAPFIGAGVGLLSSIIRDPTEYRFKKNKAFHILTGAIIYVGDLHIIIDFRYLKYDQEGSKGKFLFSAGLSY
ncbi:MAG: hypothetical protein JXB26_14660 [Candidatus Aminicenantes bacterium]|nr:hypothetical protein [Candidatus Aminicenantes bacterium]